MTDEEIEQKSEDYATDVCFDEQTGMDILFISPTEKQAFKDGAKWGMEHAIEWNEIRCSSQDLPPRSKDNYLHSVVVSNEYGEPIYYDYNCDEWCDMDGDIVSDSYKYWCELPQFKE